MKKVGQYLKSHRLKQDLSLEQAALVTKITKTTLLAIEDANDKKLPSKSYLRGFVVSYGKYLNVDTDHLLKLFSEEMGSTNPETQIDVIQKDTWKTIPLINKIRINSKTLIVSGLLALTTVAIFTRSLIKKYQNEAITPLPITSPIENPASEQEIVSVTDIKEDTISENSKVAPDPGLGSLPLQNKTTTEPGIVDQKTYGSNMKDYNELIIEAKNPVFIKLKIGDDDLKEIKLDQGQFHTVKAKSKIKFETSNASAVEVIYNGVLQSKNKLGKNKLELTY